MYDFEVINQHTAEIWFVTVEREREYDLTWAIATAVPATAQQVQDFQVVYALAKSDEHLAQAPSGGPGLGSFGLHEREHVGALIFQQDFMLSATENVRRVNLLGQIKSALGDGLVVVVVFQNGDVAKFEVKAAGAGPSACCEYVDGSARDRNGNFINDSGFGGGGSSNGEAYVQRDYGSTGSNAIRVAVGAVTYSCTFVGAVLLGCSRE